jgi:nucleoside diphosphate kinase
VSLAIERFQSMGLKLVGARWHQFTSVDVDCLYRTNRSARARSAVDELVDELFLFGESLCGLVGGSADMDPETVHQKLVQLKGPSDPFDCREGQLRRDLGATNKVLNLIHTSDSALDSRNEARRLFGKTPHFDMKNWNDVLPQASPKSKGLQPSGLILANLIKTRLAVSMPIETDLDGSIASALNSEKRVLTETSDQVTAGNLIRPFLARQLSLLGVQQHLDEAKVICSLARLGLQEPREDDRRRLRTFSKTGLSPWESLVIRAECGVL